VLLSSCDKLHVDRQDDCVGQKWWSMCSLHVTNGYIQYTYMHGMAVYDLSAYHCAKAGRYAASTDCEFMINYSYTCSCDVIIVA